MHRPLFVVAAFALVGAATACGASIQAVYEGDVRFEHCMALDSRQGVRSTLRSACWEEWVKFYTFGQTLDRVEYAKLREKQLLAAGDFEEGQVTSEPRAKSAVPDPTSAFAPPPMTMVADGGAPESDAGIEDAGVNASIDGGLSLPPGTACVDTCDEGWAACRKDCSAPACNKTCDTKHARCMRKCF